MLLWLKNGWIELNMMKKHNIIIISFLGFVFNANAADKYVTDDIDITYVVVLVLIMVSLVQLKLVKKSLLLKKVTMANTQEFKSVMVRLLGLKPVNLMMNQVIENAFLS
jgi:hypothetical protein